MAAIRAGFVLALALAAEPASAAMDYIDCHVHLLGGKDFPGAAKAAIAAMDEGGIKTCVVMSPPSVSGGDHAPFDWKEFKDSLQEYRGRFAFLGGGGTLNPLLHSAGENPDDQTKRKFEETANEIVAAGAVGFGEIAAHHLSLAEGHPYECVAPDHPLLLLLADIAAKNDVVIDLHLDIVPADMAMPPRFTSPLDPPRVKANLANFEKLLAHNPNAKFVWAHAGSDPLANRSVTLCRDLLTKHPNLYMSLRVATHGGGKGGGGGGGMMPDFVRATMAFTPDGEINPDWLKLLKDFPDRFVIGGDQFIASPKMTGGGPGLTFTKGAPMTRERTAKFLAALPADLASKIGIENAQRLYKLGR